MGWRCSLHGAVGAGNDGSLRAHEAAEHDGATITVMFTPDPDPRTDAEVVADPRPRRFTLGADGRAHDALEDVYDW